MHMLQIALDNLQMVLPNTSVAGRDAMRRDMQALQQVLTLTFYLVIIIVVVVAIIVVVVSS
jgi:hypothetical protein